MKCPRCQAENREGRRFCAECGASLAIACSSCGFSNEPGEKFCGGCGQALEVAVAPIPAAKFAALQTYTPKHLAEKILTSKSVLEGERKQVTVLFAELYRIKGELLLAQEGKREEYSEAEVCFQKAIEAARSQSAKSLELRAVRSLSRLWQKQGKKDEARRMLAEIYGWFTEGFDTADLKEAKALLEELS